MLADELPEELLKIEGACQADYGPTASYRPALDVHFQTIHRAGDQSIVSAAEALASDPDLELEARVCRRRSGSKSPRQSSENSTA